MRPQAYLGAALAAMALLAAGCGADEGAAPTAELSVTGADALRFEPDEFTVPAGETVTLSFTAESAVEHDFVIEDASEHGMVGEAGHGEHAGDDHMEETRDLHVAHAEPEESVTATFMFDEPGTYEVYCSVPGHRDAGMVATLTVVDAD